MLMRVMRNSFHPQSKKSDRERIQYNNRIIRSSDFKKSVRCAYCHINPLYRAAFAAGSYTAVKMADSLLSVKRRLFPKKRQK